MSNHFLRYRGLWLSIMGRKKADDAQQSQDTRNGWDEQTIMVFQLCEIMFHKSSLLDLISSEYLFAWLWVGLIHTLTENQENGLIQGWNWILHEKRCYFLHRCMQDSFKSRFYCSFYLLLLRCNKINEIKILIEHQYGHTGNVFK
jgi:hypothetical protein